MKRTGSLWPRLTGWENLTEAARRAALGKKRRPDVAVYLLNLEEHLARLRRDLQDETWHRPHLSPIEWFTMRSPRSPSRSSSGASFPLLMPAAPGSEPMPR